MPSDVVTRQQSTIFKLPLAYLLLANLGHWLSSLKFMASEQNGEVA
jgi:hypothetical protein